MAKTFNAKILTLDSKVLDEKIEKIFFSTAEGNVEILANHASSIFSTVPCITKVTDENGVVKEFFTAKGVVNISNNELNFCCDSSELKEDIDVARAEAAEKRAEKRISDPDKYDIERAKQALIRAQVRIKLAKQS